MSDKYCPRARRYDAAVVAVLYNYCLFVRLRAEEEEKDGARATYQLSVSATRKKEGRKVEYLLCHAELD